MLREAKRKEGLQPICTDSEKLPFLENSFERIMMVDALHHVNHQQQTADELWRVLKPGGRIVIEEPDIRIFGVKLLALAEKIAMMAQSLSGSVRDRQAIYFPANRYKI